jgi:hypothetical protein
MDSTPSMDAANTLFDLLIQKARSAKRQSGERGPKPKPPKSTSVWGPAYAVLEEEEGLFVHIPAVLNIPGSPGRPSGGIGARGRAVVEAFRQSFCDLWDRIPELDRQRLLEYWRGSKYPFTSSDRYGEPHPKPWIRLVEGDVSSPSFRACSMFGHQLDFPVSLVLGTPQHLYRQIARAVAEVFLFVTRRQNKLMNDLVETPYQRWEHEKGSRATEATCDKKWNELLAEYTRASDAEAAKIVDGWGGETPPPAGGASGRTGEP